MHTPVFTWLSVQLPEHSVNTVVEEIWQNVTAASDEAFNHASQLFSCKAVWVICGKSRWVWVKCWHLISVTAETFKYQTEKAPFPAHFEVSRILRRTVSVAAECGLSLWRSQIEVKVSCQVFDPDWWVFWEQSLTASQLLLQVPNIQLKTDKTTWGSVHLETTHSLCCVFISMWYLLWRRHNAALFLCLYDEV